MENRTNTGRKVEQEMLELNEQFSAFLNTKGIGAKFRVAIENMGQSAHQQHEADKANFLQRIIRNLQSSFIRKVLSQSTILW